ncbi:MAG: 1-acyl-sn-glycerol-3-phosphate acyltransferase [Prevotellaceae bacterium]|jgi:putative hemolysin|nr:1-acyl-sn-glycerol-3-phosphate acyltransferase [Prevotellaceae bacterium]
MAQLLDIRNILMTKNGGKEPSRLLVWLLKKILHVDEMNEFLSRSKATGGVDFADESLEFLDTKVHATGFENLDPDKKYIFVSNHPLGGLDGVSLISLIGRRYNGKIRYFVNDLLLSIHALRDISIPINKHGALSKQFYEMTNNAFDSDNQMVIFPAGKCSRFQPGKGIRDLEWKKTFVIRAVQHQRDVVPIYFEGRNSVFFYALSFIRCSLGIKLNIEMLFLPHEMFLNRHKSFRAYIGKPISWQTFDASKTPKQWAQYVKQISEEELNPNYKTKKSS